MTDGPSSGRQVHVWKLKDMRESLNVLPTRPGRGNIEHDNYAILLYSGDSFHYLYWVDVDVRRLIVGYGKKSLSWAAENCDWQSWSFFLREGTQELM